MPADFSAKHASPILAVADMEQTLDFYTRVLLFERVLAAPDWGIVGKDHGQLHFRLADNPEAVPSREIYVEVTGIDALWEHVSQFQSDYKMRELFVQDYGWKEFHIIAPNDCLVFVGEQI